MEAQTETEAQVAKTRARKPAMETQAEAKARLEALRPPPPTLTDAQRNAIAGIARSVAEDVFAERIAAALADPDVKGSKSVLGYLLGRTRRR